MIEPGHIQIIHRHSDNFWHEISACLRALRKSDRLFISCSNKRLLNAGPLAVQTDGSLVGVFAVCNNKIGFIAPMDTSLLAAHGVLAKILSKLEKDDVITCLAVCKTFNHTIEENWKTMDRYSMEMSVLRNHHYILVQITPDMTPHEARMWGVQNYDRPSTQRRSIIRVTYTHLEEVGEERAPNLLQAFIRGKTGCEIDIEKGTKTLSSMAPDIVESEEAKNDSKIFDNFYFECFPNVKPFELRSRLEITNQTEGLNDFVNFVTNRYSLEKIIIGAVTDPKSLFSGYVTPNLDIVRILGLPAVPPGETSPGRLVVYLNQNFSTERLRDLYIRVKCTQESMKLAFQQFLTEWSQMQRSFGKRTILQLDTWSWATMNTEDSILQDVEKLLDVLPISVDRKSKSENFRGPPHRKTPNI